MLTIEELTWKARAIWRLRIDKRATLREVSRRMQRRPGFVGALASNGRGLRFHDKIKSLAAAGYRRGQEIYYETTVSLDDDPTGVLDYAREMQGLQPDAFLESVRPRIEALGLRGPTRRGIWTCLQADIRRLDLLRRRDRQAAISELKPLLLSSLDALDQGKRPRRALADICGLLFVLTAIYRLAGRRDDAVTWLELAWPIVRQLKSFKVRGYWYHKAAILLVDLDYCTRALDFIKQAHNDFDIANARAERLQALVDQAYVLFHAKRYEESRAILELVLPRLPAHDREYRVTAHQLLSANQQERGLLAEARRQLEAACALVAEGDNLARAYCLWRLGKLHVRMKQVPSALNLMAQAMPLFAKLTSAGELAEMGMEYAELLMKEKRRPELQSLAADLAGWIEELQGNSKLRGMINRFQVLVAFDEFNGSTYRELLVQLKAAKEAMRVCATKARGKPRTKR